MTGAPYREGPSREELARMKAERALAERAARLAEACRACGVTPVSLARALLALFSDPRRIY